MRVLILDAYHSPEITADTHLENDLIEALIQKGYELEIICPIPSRGIDNETYEEYKDKRKERISRFLTVNRFWAPKEPKNPVLRALRYFWCSYRTIKISNKISGIDRIYAVSTPPIMGMTCISIKKRIQKKRKKRIPIIYYLEDIFPDTLVSTGLAKSESFAFKIGRIIERYTYKHTDRIVVISEGGRDNLINKGVRPNKIAVVRNWIDLSTVKKINRENNILFDKYHLDRISFYIVYAGNLGEAQNVNLMVKLAERINEPNVQFVIFGSGGEEENIRNSIKDRRLSNIFIFPLESIENVPYVYSLGDVNFITCKAGMATSALPSKTWSIMACKGPIVASYDTNSDLANVLRTSNAGICISPNNFEGLVMAIKKFYEMSEEERVKIGEQGYKYVMETREKSKCVKQLVRLIEKE